MDYLRASFSKFIIRHRLPLIVLTNFVLIALSNYLAFWLRFDGEIPPKSFELMKDMLPVLILIRASLFFVYHLYRGLWRYTGIWELWSILSATFIGSTIFFVLTHFILGIPAYPRSIFIIDSILLVFFLGGIRLPWRIYREFIRTAKGKRVLIYGAGDAGEMIVRDMKNHPQYRYNPIGFVDDDGAKAGQSIHGVPVLGTRNSLSSIIPDRRVEEVILAIPSAEPCVVREVLRHLEPFNIPIKTTPNLRDIYDEKVTVGQIRKLAVEDLLTRMPVSLDLTPVRKMLEGKRVLVTGAGGSIGGELCRQIAKLNPSELILYDRYENGLHWIASELTRNGNGHNMRTIVGDITDRILVNQIFRTHTPDVVFHAAAHKHVPLMEVNPCEAIKNNVTGTRVLAKAAVACGVGKFVFISSDKAVNPTSVMGASKRVAEMIITTLADHSMTSFVAVRFGNVLGSKGSVVPLFLEQIKKGGPVTVTDPKMQRYFMLIPEAVQLVLYASTMGGDALTYVLRMGDQIKVSEMARNLIRLSGLIPDVDIPIVYTGLRPGEKLYEELVANDEIEEPSTIQQIVKIRQTRQPDSIFLRKKVREMERASSLGDPERVIDCLKALIANYKQSKVPAASIEQL
ncbi:polysaccharide biosynthesis protein [bacterium]|nr:polysaccharide biosynthesis protein [bacterium]